MKKKPSKRDFVEEIKELRKQKILIERQINVAHSFFHQEYPGKMLCRDCLEVCPYNLTGICCNCMADRIIAKRDE